MKAAGGDSDYTYYMDEEGVVNASEVEWLKSYVRSSVHRLGS